MTDDENRAKIKTWIYILEEYAAGRGAKRIANQLNSFGIPSPGAGTVRTDGGVKHRVSGKWSPSTVLDLIKNSAIAGDKTYGVRSEGKHRRLDDDGWRYLNDNDRDADDNPKVVRNPDQLGRQGAEWCWSELRPTATGPNSGEVSETWSQSARNTARERSGKISAQWSGHRPNGRLRLSDVRSYAIRPAAIQVRSLHANRRHRNATTTRSTPTRCCVTCSVPF